MKSSFWLVSALLGLTTCATEPRLEAFRWYRVESEAMSLVSTRSPEAFTAIVERLAWFEGVLRYLTGLEEPPAMPLLVVVLERASDFEHYSPLAGAAGLHTFRRDASLVVLDGSRAGGIDEVLLHEYTHHFLEPHADLYELWHQEGLAEYASRFQVDRNELVLGKADPLVLNFLRGRGQMDLNLLLRLTPADSTYAGLNESGFYHGTAWALYHYLRLGPIKGALSTYKRNLIVGAPVAQALEDASGARLSQLGNRVASYLSASSLPVERVPIVTFRVEKPATKTSRMTAGEVRELVESLEELRSIPNPGRD